MGIWIQINDHYTGVPVVTSIHKVRAKTSACEKRVVNAIANQNKYNKLNQSQLIKHRSGRLSSNIILPCGSAGNTCLKVMMDCVFSSDWSNICCYFSSVYTTRPRSIANSEVILTRSFRMSFIWKRALMNTKKKFFFSSQRSIVRSTSLPLGTNFILT